ncbi:hypothetical protein H0H93_012256 [Arthromyces matolae]|nr:hypothetical protein H0H93_012256 [Arthromyces matolae]
MFVRGINAIYAQAMDIEARKAKSFAFFCNALMEMIHHHHTLEEELVFPFYESRMGANAMGHNVEQHHDFLPGLEDFEAYVKDVLNGKAVYSGDLTIKKLDSFADIMVKHLREEIPTLKSSRIRATCTEADLKSLNESIGKRILEGVSISTMLPLGIILHDKSSEPKYRPIPKAIIWFGQYVLWHIHSDAWAFGPSDAFGKPKPGFEAKA